MTSIMFIEIQKSSWMDCKALYAQPELLYLTISDVNNGDCPSKAGDRVCDL